MRGLEFVDPHGYQFNAGALEEALATRDVKPGLIHHSDRGVQYASIAYTERLLSMGVHISMSAKGNAYDNAKAESFFKTLKTRGGVPEAVPDF